MAECEKTQRLLASVFAVVIAGAQIRLTQPRASLGYADAPLYLGNKRGGESPWAGDTEVGAVNVETSGLIFSRTHD